MHPRIARPQVMRSEEMLGRPAQCQLWDEVEGWAEATSERRQRQPGGEEEAGVVEAAA